MMNLALLAPAIAAFVAGGVLYFFARHVRAKADTALQTESTAEQPQRPFDSSTVVAAAGALAAQTLVAISKRKSVSTEGNVTAKTTKTNAS